jgi:hypothetical protein
MDPTRAGSIVRVPSRRVLFSLPARVVVFLWGIGSHATARSLMALGGYAERDHQEGCALLAAVMRYGSDGADIADDSPAREALDELIRWVRTHFARLGAAIHRELPESRLFAEIEAPAEGTELLALATLLRRLDVAGESAPVVEVMARRGIDVAERSRLARLVELAQSAPPPDRPGPIRDSRVVELLALHRWYSDWAATARALIARKDLLIGLGLARRREPVTDA